MEEKYLVAIEIISFISFTEKEEKYIVAIEILSFISFMEKEEKYLLQPHVLSLLNKYIPVLNMTIKVLSIGLPLKSI